MTKTLQVKKTMNSLNALKKLKIELNSALELQQYHGLLDLDTRIKQQVTEIMSCHVVSGNADGGLRKDESENIKKEFVDLMNVYQRVVSKCQDKSNDLKKACLELKASKKNTDKYLDVAGRF